MDFVTRAVYFLETGYVGCESCDTAFESIMLPIVKNIHKKTRHIGKFISFNYGDEDLSKKLVELTRQLQVFVEAEEYEKASQVKAQINKVKEELL